jgi:2-polyprenyl-6-methoxyphenol hydroxylase-like FAD-dependent oxidoreductase
MDLVRDSSGRVTGLVLEERDRSLHRIEAGIVIGADGLRSNVARHAGAAIYREGPHACGVVYGFWPGLENEGTRWYYRPGVSVGVIPTHADQSCIFVAVASARFPRELQGDMESGYRRLMATGTAALAERLAALEPTEPLRGYPGHPGIMRQSHGPGWALVGDAGYFKDPITAHGISDALRDAELLARAVEQGTDRALAAYQATRDRLSGELFEVTDAIAAFEWDLEAVRALHRRLSRAMNEEVEALLALEALPARRGATSPEPPAGGEPSI